MTRGITTTYRLQLNAEFTLHDARTRVPYLHALGVSHLYCAPVLTARKGSTHGYDVADPAHVSEALGGEEALVALANDVHARGMGIVLDIVPNHMGIGPDNPYWEDLLERGRASQYAEWFDVSWRAPTKRLAGKVLVPILGDTLANVMERDEITLVANDRGVRAKYFDHAFPLDPATLPPDVEVALRDPSARDLLTTWSHGVEGRTRLRRLLGKQHYELAFWRTAQRDLNYRRFFDVNELISLRVEREDVFAATHRKILELVARGVIDGLRVDHIDGLLEPKRYLERLRAAVEKATPHRIPIYVEKILAHGETLPTDWPVDGTTGYEFLVALEDIFIEETGATAIETRYRGRGEKRGFNRISVESKRRVLRGALNADVRRVAPMLAAVAKRAGWPLQSVAAYAGVIVEFVAELPVYRTYIDSASQTPSPRDRELIERTLEDVQSRTTISAEPLNALRRALLDDWSAYDASVARARLDFVLRLQQLSGPAAAKGVEDTALYAYAPLTSRCEVGSDPAVRVQGAMERLGERLTERAVRFPLSLNATNTHDTKRSADARARIDALSEHADEWRRTLERWRRVHRELRTKVGGKLVPSRAADDFVYQSLLAVWPLTSESLAGDEWIQQLRERLTAYLQKASREAKVSTNWTDPDTAYEQALTQFLNGLLDSKHASAFHADTSRFVRLLAPQALWNALGRLVIHLMAPGVPDVYQGDELWYAALVDPDNRRPIDWSVREEALDAAKAIATESDRTRTLAELRDAMKAGDLKMFITHELLALRKATEGITTGRFHMLNASGVHGANAVAFERQLSSGEHIIVLTGRHTGALSWPQAGNAWGDTRIAINDGGEGLFRRVIHGGVVRTDRGSIGLGDAFPALPVEVLVRTGN